MRKFLIATLCCGLSFVYGENETPQPTPLVESNTTKELCPCGCGCKAPCNCGCVTTKSCNCHEHPAKESPNKPI